MSRSIAKCQWQNSPCMVFLLKNHVKLKYFDVSFKRYFVILFHIKFVDFYTCLTEFE